MPEGSATDCHYFLVQILCVQPSAFCVMWQNSCELRCLIKTSILCDLKSNLQNLSGLRDTVWTSIAESDWEYRPHLLLLSPILPRLLYCSPDFEGPQMLTDWQALLFILVIFLHLECVEDDTCWAPAASTCGVCLGRIVAPFEGSGGVFVPVLYSVGRDESHTVRSDGVYHWQAEWWPLNRLRNMTDLQRQHCSSCQFSHIHEPSSVGRFPSPELSMQISTLQS